MSKICDVTGAKSIVGGRYCNDVRATKYNPVGKVRRQVNLKKRAIFIPELNKTVHITVSTRALKTIAKNGAFATLKKAGII